MNIASSTATPAEIQGSSVYLWLVTFVATLGGLLFGYDCSVIAGAIGYMEKRFALDSAMTGWVVSCALVGCILGAIIAGPLNDRLGRRKVLLIAAVLFLISALGTALSSNLAEFVVFRILGGVGVGAASMTSPMYIAELAPSRVRGRMVSVNQFAIIVGQLTVYIVNYIIAASHSEAWNIMYGWRWMFGSEVLPAGMFLLLLTLVPESPRWLAKQGRSIEAIGVLARVNGTRQAQMELTAIGAALRREAGSLEELFRPGLRAMLAIGIGIALAQQFTGITAFVYYTPEIFKKLGYETNAALLSTILFGATNLIFTVFAIWTIDWIGRKPLLYVGVAGMGISLFILGGAAWCQQSGTWLLVFVLGYIACYAFSLGPITWLMISEIFPTRIRGRAMAIATVSLWCGATIVTQTFPMINDNRYLVVTFHRGFTFLLYGVMCIATILFVWCLVPETKGKSLEEIETMLGNGEPSENQPCGPGNRSRDNRE